ncbi:twin-arginine translocase TatA/TatE family subunit [Alkaliphilus sp. B6464]|uniref:twin-arginine translocase TatA/TatE family subunit n=1 Tax=Alkaliphilus sp. B6464 TaxID=2731219 RepID=UPI001BA73328|nr:twin-arginine translocase TatA/TatE family subunit [Alkaliphilus sp. B6464]QUH20072.1 twin-arginine translocase TatA/TatE family subunit [Alkaliphilus sp. B6464]
MFGKIGTGELVLILAIALIVVGPGKLPELGKALGKSISEFKKFSNEIKEDISLEDKKAK